jgi:hypothetical protein
LFPLLVWLVLKHSPSCTFSIPSFYTFLLGCLYSRQSPRIGGFLSIIIVNYSKGS